MYLDTSVPYNKKATISSNVQKVAQGLKIKVGAGLRYLIF